MSEQLTIVFFLWRRAEMSPAAYEDFYNNDHQELVARTVSPPPLLFERHFRDEDAVVDPSAARSPASFDSFTAATFASHADFESWGAIPADPGIAKALDDNEAEFTQPDRRMQLFAEPVRTGSTSPVQAPGAAHLVRLATAEPGTDRAAFRAGYEAAIARGEPIDGALRRVRYYPRPEHPMSYARSDWADGLAAAPDVIEQLSSRDARSAQRALADLRSPADGPGELASESIIAVRQVMRPPAAWQDR